MDWNALNKSDLLKNVDKLKKKDKFKRGRCDDEETQDNLV